MIDLRIHLNSILVSQYPGEIFRKHFWELVYFVERLPRTGKPGRIRYKMAPAGRYVHSLAQRIRYLASLPSVLQRNVPSSWGCNIITLSIQIKNIKTAASNDLGYFPANMLNITVSRSVFLQIQDPEDLWDTNCATINEAEVVDCDSNDHFDG